MFKCLSLLTGHLWTNAARGESTRYDQILAQKLDIKQDFKKGLFNTLQSQNAFGSFPGTFLLRALTDLTHNALKTSHELPRCPQRPQSDFDLPAFHRQHAQYVTSPPPRDHRHKQQATRPEQPTRARRRLLVLSMNGRTELFLCNDQVYLFLC